MTDTVIVEQGRHRAIVSGHRQQVYLCVGVGGGGSAMLLNPIHALEIAAALTVYAGGALQRQFAEQLGGS